MEKLIALFLSLSISLLSGCSSIDIKGKPFYKTNVFQDSQPNSQSEEIEFRALEKFLYEATEGNKKNQVTAGEIKELIPGNPKMIVTKSSETWVYEYTRTEDSLKMGWSGLMGRNSVKTERLELNFNKNLILTDYKLNPDPFVAENSNQKIKWGFLILKWIFVGAAVGVVAGAVLKQKK